MRIAPGGASSANLQCGAVAQLGERLTGSQKVVGSIPIGSTTFPFQSIEIRLETPWGIQFAYPASGLSLWPTICDPSNLLRPSILLMILGLKCSSIHEAKGPVLVADRTQLSSPTKHRLDRCLRCHQRAGARGGARPTSNRVAFLG